ncbi:MAG: serine/threonine-protein kinase, partial [Deltaproteobacteria bacterium]|nr:serine/threonine-protein kinase [Deltaproteobacteria bacterium]
MAQQQPKNFGEYTLLRQLGSGGFGEVWLTRDKADQEVALKFLNLNPDKTAYVNLFKHEFELLCELRHAHLARVFDFGLSPDKKRYYFTQEFCSGQNFFAAMEGKQLEYFEETFVQLLSALDYIHARGVVHFDIKADNIIVSEQEKKPFVKILDFGVAAKIKSLPELIGGTPIYMPPELIARSSGIDHRVDLYALGILILRVLTKKLPFDPEKIDEITDWHLHGAFPKEIWDGTSVPVYLREIVEKLLQKNPNDRFSSARVVLNFLNRTTNGKYQKAEEGLGLFIPQEGPLVGREAILEKIKKEMDRRASVIFLAGESGIGKTRVLEETRRLIELREEMPVHLVCQREKSFWPNLVSALSLAETVMDEPDEAWLAKRRAVLCMEKARQHSFSLLIDETEKGGRELELFLAALQEDFSHGDGGRFFVLVAREQEKGDIVLKKLSLADVQSYIAMTLGDSDRLEQAAKLLYKYSGGLPLLM